MWFLVLILSVLIVLFTYCMDLFNRPVTESFVIEQEVSAPHPDSVYVVPEAAFELQCSRSRIRPTDVRLMNVFEYFDDPTNVFVGIASSKRQYLVLKRKDTNPSVKYVSDIPDASIVAFVSDSDKHVMNRIIAKVYERSSSSITFKQLETNHVSKHCDTVDVTHNTFVDFLKSDADYLIVGINEVFQKTLLEHYYKAFDDNRCTLLGFKKEKTTSTKLNMFFFNHVLLKANNLTSGKVEEAVEIIRLDELVVAKEKAKYDFNKLEKNRYIDYDTTQIYMDLYECEVPEEISSRMRKLVALNKVIQNTKGSTDSCAKDTKIVHNDNGRENSYVSKHCLAKKNLFVDITYPFVTDDIDVKISSLDFTELAIRSKTFDDMIPISNAITKNNATIPRYKINVDPTEYPSEAFVNDIYYGSYLDQEGIFTILTNSVPFDLNASIHKIEPEYRGRTNLVSYKIMLKDEESDELLASYQSPNGDEVSVQLHEGDRVFVNPEKIFDADLEKFLVEKLGMEEKNYYHGFVGTDTKTSQLYVSLKDVRKEHVLGTTSYSSDIRAIGSCFDENWELMANGPKNKEECEAIPNHTWDVPCRYNSECPYFGSNKNYNNFFGGCLSSGFCEMPVGVNQQSYTKRKDANDNKPICYNCDSANDGDCCDSQNSNLQSPDYMFPMDTSTRIREMYAFKDTDCSLMVNKYI